LLWIVVDVTCTISRFQDVGSFQLNPLVTTFRLMTVFATTIIKIPTLQTYFSLKFVKTVGYMKPKTSDLCTLNWKSSCDVMLFMCQSTCTISRFQDVGSFQLNPLVTTFRLMTVFVIIIYPYFLLITSQPADKISHTK
jgi:hypothetical protein